MANVSALKMARRNVQATVYASVEEHYSLSRAMDMLGMGRRSLRLVPADRTGRIRLDALTDRIDDDRRAGHRPVAIVGMAGATATGAIDPLGELAAIAAEHSMWFHIEGAAAAVFADLSRTRPEFAGLALAGLGHLGSAQMAVPALRARMSAGPRAESALDQLLRTGALLES
ncbi:pyridoxal-dependent decarboxylase [Amycolatopsis decaplanina]|uniref:pyridoxal-dependent decarboxylase n=1 Tax=Amycolatopsis decaplanina TaxID=208441 RepID=UPI0012678753